MFPRDAGFGSRLGQEPFGGIDADFQFLDECLLDTSDDLGGLIGHGIETGIDAAERRCASVAGGSSIFPSGPSARTNAPSGGKKSPRYSRDWGYLSLVLERWQVYSRAH